MRNLKTLFFLFSIIAVLAISPFKVHAIEFPIPVCREQPSYDHFEKELEALSEIIDKAKLSATPYSALAEKSFQEANLDDASKHSKAEIELYPVGKFGDFRFRIFSAPPLINREAFNSLPLQFQFNCDPFLEIRKLDIDQSGYLTLYKVIPLKHFNSIRKSGLDSKYGGIGGASEKIGSAMVRSHDRGKMFLSSSLAPVGATSGYRNAFPDGSVALMIRIPASEAFEYNLTWNTMEWFIAGTKILPDKLFVEENPYMTFQQFIKDPNNRAFEKNGTTFYPIEDLELK